MAKIYHDGDADLEILKERTIGVIGYGNQGRAQSLNMRDSGLRVTVGNRDDEYKDRAIQDGFDAQPIEAVARASNVILMLIPDEVQPEVCERQIRPHLRAGDALCFASGYNIHCRRIIPPKDVDVIMTAPRMIGQGVRNLYQQGAGFPCLIGVHQDASGRALDLALALAKAIGATRLGAFHSSFEEETLIDLFAEQMLWPGIIKLCTLYFERLVENGCDPDIVATELHLSGEFVEVARAMITEGFFKQLRLHSHTSQYGQLSRAERMAPKALLRQIDKAMEEIRSGAFAREWAAEQERGCPGLQGLTRKALEHPLNAAEERLASLKDAMARVYIHRGINNATPRPRNRQY